MGTQQPYHEQEHEEMPPRSFLARVRERLWGAEEHEEYEEETVPEARRRAAIRLETARGVRVAVRLNATVLNDARTAADGLKNGQQQIVNLERTTPEMAERIIDFLSGVTYALDGSVERIGEKVFLFAPANFKVEVDSTTHSSMNS